MNQPTQVFTFSKCSRLNNPQEFRRVFSSSKIRIRRRWLMVRAAKQEVTGKARLGITVAKSALPRAVDRNRLKRYIRDSFRKEGRAHPGWDFVFQAQRNSSALCWESLKQELSELWLAVQSSRVR